MPSIVGFRLVTPLPSAGRQGCLAVLTIEDGPWIIGGVRLYIAENGKLFLKPPKMKVAEDRIVLRAGAVRDAVLAEALHHIRGMLNARIADTPLATAPETSEREHGNPS